MRHIIILGDGMADEPCEELGGLTPLESAYTPALDELARRGRNGLLSTVPDGYNPDSDIAHLSILGYNVGEVYEGRGPLEAAGMGVDLAQDEIALRCNLICIAPDGHIKSHSAGHISSEEASELIASLNDSLADGRHRFYQGVGYRHLLKVRMADRRIKCAAPHEVVGHPACGETVTPMTPGAEETADYINELVARSQEVLREHPVNLRRMEEGRDPANSIWPWSAGISPVMRPLSQMFGIGCGHVISAVNHIRGIGICAGLKPIYVEGATGMNDTNYSGKIQAAVNALRGGSDFVFLHVEACDEAGHDGDAMLKKFAVENIDRLIVAPLLDAISNFEDEVAVAVLPDHPTPCKIRRHTCAPVPFVIWRSDVESDSVTAYSERQAAGGGYALLKGDEFIREFLRQPTGRV